MHKNLFGLTTILVLTACGGGVDVGGPRSDNQALGQADESDGELKEESSTEMPGNTGACQAGPCIGSATDYADSDTDTVPAEPIPDARETAASFTGDNATCESDADCCVVFDACKQDPYVVSASNNEATRTLLDGAEMTLCTTGIPPAIQLSCESGQCVGTATTLDENTNAALSQDHCGALSDEAATGG